MLKHATNHTQDRYHTLIKTLYISLILVLTQSFLIAQNRIELIPTDCSSENGFTMFLLDRAKPKILKGQPIEKGHQYWGNSKKIINNSSEIIKIRYTNIFGQLIDTTFTNAKQLTEIKICVNRFKDYQKKSLIKESIESKKSWFLSTTWGHQNFEFDRIVLKPKNEFLKFKYSKNGKRIKRGKIKITDFVIERIALFERKLVLMNKADNSCNFGIAYYLNNGFDAIKFQDNSCSGFNNEQLLAELKIVEK